MAQTTNNVMISRIDRLVSQLKSTKGYAIKEYLHTYEQFANVCGEENKNLSKTEIAILFHGYITGGK